MISFFRYYFRLWLGRCVTCGVKIISIKPNDVYYRQPWKNCCRWCNKKIVHSRTFYGA